TRGGRGPGPAGAHGGGNGFAPSIIPHPAGPGPRLGQSAPRPPGERHPDWRARLDPGQGDGTKSPDTGPHADHLPRESGTNLAFRRGTAAPLRPARTALHVLPDRAALRRGLRRDRLPRHRAAQQPGPDPAADLAVRAYPVLPEPVLLLR